MVSLHYSGSTLAPTNSITLKDMIRLIIITIAICLIGCLKRPDSTPYEEFRRELAVALKSEDTLSAIEILEEFNRENPDSVEMQGALVVLKAHAGLISKEEAFKKLMELREKDSLNFFTRDLKAIELIEEGRPEDALAELDRLISEQPLDFWNYIEKGRKLIELKRYDEAIATYNKAMEIEPENKYPHAERALAKYLKGDKEGACKDWETPGGGAIIYREKYCK